MKKHLAFASMIFVLSLALSSCGAVNGPSTTINVTMTDFHFEPMQFTIPAGQEITVKATNNGAVQHEFVVFKLGTDAGDHFGSEDEENIYWELEVQPGETVTGTFIAPNDIGDYSITCGIEGHLEAGMSAKLVVVADK